MFWVLAILWLTMLVPILSGIWLKNKLDKPTKFFVLFTVFSLLFDVLNTYIGIVYKDNQWLFKIFLICDLIFFVWYYHFVFDKPLWSISINIFFIITLITIEILTTHFQNLNLYASWFHFMLFVFFIIQSAVAILKSFKVFENNIFVQPVFWISFGRLFYFLLIVFVFVYPKLIYKGIDNKLIATVNSFVNLFANFCLYTLYAIGILCLRMKK